MSIVRGGIDEYSPRQCNAPKQPSPWMKMREKKIEGWGNLLLAAYKGRKGTVETLLEKNADPNETDNLGRTATGPVCPPSPCRATFAAPERPNRP